jgi:hypothetical protein
MPPGSHDAWLRGTPVPPSGPTSVNGARIFDPLTTVEQNDHVGAAACLMKRAVAAVAVGALPDGIPVIVGGSRDGTVRVWGLADGTPARSRRGQRHCTSPRIWLLSFEHLDSEGGRCGHRRPGRCDI